MTLKTVWVGMSNGGYVRDLVVQEKEPASQDGKTWRKVAIHSGDTTVVPAETLEEAIDLVNDLKNDYANELVIKEVNLDDLDAETRASVELGIQQAREGRFAEAPDLEEALVLAETLDEALATVKAVKEGTFLEQSYNDMWYKQWEAEDRETLKLLDEESAENPLKEAVDLINGCKEDMDVMRVADLKEKIEAKEANEAEMIEYVKKRVRFQLQDTLKPPTREDVIVSNRKWIEIAEAALQNQWELFEEFGVTDRIEKGEMDLHLNFRYDQELKVARFVECRTNYQYNHPESLKFTRMRFTVDEKFWEEGKDDDPEK